MTRIVSEETRKRQSEAARVRWDPTLRQQAVFEKIHKLLSGYYGDHPDARFSPEQVYAVICSMGYRTEHPMGVAREFFDGSENLLR